jgi:hypothetical protein
MVAPRCVYLLLLLATLGVVRGKPRRTPMVATIRKIARGREFT